jgi:hypothetical protein
MKDVSDPEAQTRREGGRMKTGMFPTSARCLLFARTRCPKKSQKVPSGKKRSGGALGERTVRQGVTIRTFGAGAKGWDMAALIPPGWGWI